MYVKITVTAYNDRWEYNGDEREVGLESDDSQTLKQMAGGTAHSLQGLIINAIEELERQNEAAATDATEEQDA